MSYTFKINNVDYSSVIQKYGYATALTPVYSESMQSINGIEYVAVLRYRGSLTIRLKPLESSTLSTFVSALSTGILSVSYTCLQRNSVVTANMKLDAVSSEKILENASRTLVGNTTLTFIEL